MGTSRSASAKGNSMGRKRASLGSCGVVPPIPNQALASTTVKPMAKILIATQETTWLPRLVTQA